MKQNANSLTIAIVTYLNLNGYKVWRQNTVGIYNVKRQAYMKNPNNMKGVSDIIGFNKTTGVFIAVEVKVGRDKLSQDQIYFKEDVLKAGGVYVEARSLDGFIDEFKKL